MDRYEPKKIVGKPQPNSAWRELELLNDVVEFVREKTGIEPLTMQDLGDGHAPIRKSVGRPEPS